MSEEQTSAIRAIAAEFWPVTDQTRLEITSEADLVSGEAYSRAEPGQALPPAAAPLELSSIKVAPLIRYGRYELAYFAGDDRLIVTLQNPKSKI